MSDIMELTSPARVIPVSRFATFLELTKPRISALVLVTTSVGFYLAAQGFSHWMDLLRMIHALVGTALVAAGANTINQYLEVEWDRRMARTQMRPLPSGRLAANEALGFGLLSAAGGVLYLSLFANPLAGLLAALSFAVYVFAYTPLKRRTPFCVYVGAISGALPPVIGWAAGAGTLDLEAWLLFAILFFWQLPHFAAIAWLYRDDYARAGFPMIGVPDGKGSQTDLHVVTHTVALLMASLLPVRFGTAGVAYAVAATLLGLAFLACSAAFVASKTPGWAKSEILASVVYLPLLFGALLLDRAIAF